MRLLLLCLMNSSWMAGQAADPELEPRLEQIIQAHVADHSFMGSVLIAKGDSVMLSGGYGSADLEWNIPNSPDTKFRLGSITKQFTASCVLLREEQGKWAVSDPVKKYIPDPPAAWDNITLLHLLTHTSGIPSFTPCPDHRDTQAQATTPQNLVERFREKPLDFEPEQSATTPTLDMGCWDI